MIAQTVVYSELMTTIDQLNARSEGYLPGLLGIEFLTLEPGRLTSRLPLRPELLAPNGYLHAAAVIALADTACGYGTFTDLPDGAHNFTTIELKSNFLGSTRKGVIACVATRVHSGRTTQVWDATVTDEASGKTIALFRCTQLILYPRA
jgi:1,4-dihydroxy-2-naphthoyl-CoA hydrolase